MYYIHIKSQILYKYIKSALFQNEKGEWVKCVIYENQERMTFVRLDEDFEKSFTKKVYTLKELNQMESDAGNEMQDIFKLKGMITPLDSMRYIERMKFIEYQKEQL